MVRIAYVLVGLFVTVIASVGGLGDGCKDLKQSADISKGYPKYRDMRRTVVLAPQKIVTRAPDSLSVPITGREPEVPAGDARMLLTAKMVNPVATSDSSVAMGQRLFTRTCTPCHGVSMAGDGKVAALFMPPPDLLGASARGRDDGFIYGYIRWGGAIMPRYGQSITAEEAWHLVNFIRHMQRTSPR
jgi:mono/diheme cytochrome c family protein